MLGLKQRSEGGREDYETSLQASPPSETSSLVVPQCEVRRRPHASRHRHRRAKSIGDIDSLRPTQTSVWQKLPAFLDTSDEEGRLVWYLSRLNRQKSSCLVVSVNENNYLANEVRYNGFVVKWLISYTGYDKNNDVVSHLEHQNRTNHHSIKQQSMCTHS